MNLMRMVNIAVFVFFVIGSIYYTAADGKEAQGAIVMLLGILYFVALPHMKES